MLGLSLGLVLAVRIGGPSDLYDNDQPKTVAYTADVVIHGRWVLPRDHMPHPDHVHDGRPATKPPMYNWLGALAVKATGQWDEWVLKLPSLAAGVAIMCICAAMGAYMARRRDGGPLPGDRYVPGAIAAVATVAPACWLSSYATVKLIYTARPDMLLTAFLAGAWASATIALDRWSRARQSAGSAPIAASGRTPKGTFVMSVLFWGCVTGAALTKGVPALLPILYVILSAKLVHGRWAAVNAVQWWGGLPVAALLLGNWLWAAHRVDPHHFYDTLVMAEVVDRAGGDGLLQVLLTVGYLPAWFFARFAPWSIFVALMMIHVMRHLPPGQWRTHRLAPAVIWVLLVIVFFSLSGSKRADYLAPAYPAAAILAAHWLIIVAGRHGVSAARAVAAALVVVAALGTYQVRSSAAARSQLGEHVRAFANDVQQLTGEDPIVFHRTGYNPLQTLMGRHQPGDPTARDLAEARWIIAPSSADPPTRAQQAAVSLPIPEVHDGQSGGLTLWRIDRPLGYNSTGTQENR